MKIKFFYVLFIFPIYLISQSTISGSVIDENKKPIPFCNVILINTLNDQNFGGGITNEYGDFKIEVYQEGTYKIKVINMGFKEYLSKPLNISTELKLLDLGKIILNETSYVLNDVSVTAKKIPIQKKIDRTVINLEDDPGTSGSTILDVLERTPGVIIDRQNESINMLGKGGVNVMLNGKLTYMPSSALVQYLNGINAENVKSIELITTPPSKFDAEGNAGFINIELRKNLDKGYNGNLTLSSTYAERKPSNNIGFNFNATEKRHSLSFNYSGNKRDIPINGRINRNIPTENGIQITNIEAFRKNSRTVHNLRFSYDLKMSDKITFGTSVIGYSNKYEMIEDKIAIHSNLLIGEDVYFTDEINLWESAQIQAFIKYDFNENTFFDLNFDRLKYSNYQPVNYAITLDINNENLDFGTVKQSPFDINVFSLDFEKKINSKLKYTGGVKSVFNEFSNKNEFLSEEEYYSGFNNSSFLEENVFALYSQLNINVSEKISLQSGVRYEHTLTDINDVISNSLLVSRNYGNFFPSIYLGYKINDSNNFNLSLSRRINRPAFTDLAPFTFFVDVDQAFQGNVSLLPSYTNNVETSYRVKNLLFTIQYSEEKNLISKFQPQINLDTGFITIIPRNLDLQKSANIQFSYSAYPFQFWNLRMFSSYTYAEIEHQLEDALYTNSNSSFRFTLNNSFEIGNNFSFQIWGYYNTRSIFGLNETLPRGSLNLAIQKKIENLTITLNGNNLLDTEHWRFETNNPDDGFNQYFDLDFRPPQVKLSAIYNFGDKNIKSKKSNQRNGSTRMQVGS
tara:strand:- start:467 stop:2854 length:2388 start_codon:yes stop_codon:yes gene_type:complete